jgi:hypothetical protein
MSEPTEPRAERAAKAHFTARSSAPREN